MANDTMSGQTAVKRILAGEPLSEVLGVSDEQMQNIAALASNLYQQGKLQEAETLFRGLIATNKNCWYGYAGVGAVALAKQPPDLNTAFESLTRAAEENPSDATIQANLGEVLVRQGKFQEAANQYKKAFDLDPDRKDPGVNRARAIIAGLTSIANEVNRLKRGESATAA